MPQKISLLLFLFLFITPLYADLRVDSPECRAVILKDDGTWQYVTTIETAKSYRKLSFSELKQNFTKYKGEDLQVSGTAVTIIDSYFLKEDSDDETPIEMNLQAIPKGLVDKLESQCDKGCNVVAFGQTFVDDEGYKTFRLEQLLID